MDDSQITNDPATSPVITLPPAPCTVIITGRVSGTADPARRGPFFLGPDSYEKIFNLRVEEPTVVSFATSFRNEKSLLGTILAIVPPEGPAGLRAENDLLDSSEELRNISPQTIVPHVLLPEKQYVYSISGFECPDCGMDNSRIVSPETEYTIEIGIGGDRVVVSLDPGPRAYGLLVRAGSAPGRLTVNRFTLDGDLGLELGQGVTLEALRVFMVNPFTVGGPSRVTAELIVFTVPKGTERPPDNPVLLVKQPVVIEPIDRWQDIRLIAPVRLNANQEVFAGYFTPGPGALQAIAWLFMNQRTQNRTFFTRSMTNEMILSGWQLESFTSSSGVTSSGPLMVRLVVRLPDASENRLLESAQQ
jgi:hypothetical protein